jgi:hypothetical protein
MNKLNTIKAAGLIANAKRSIKIIEALLAGKTNGEVLDELENLKPRVERNLVEYYRKQLQ